MASQQALSWNPETALIVVDLQNDFAHPQGNLFVEGGDEIVTTVNRLIDEASGAGALVVYTQDWHPPITPHFVDSGGAWPRHCVRDTWGARLVEGLAVRGLIIRKGVGEEDGYSGFREHDSLRGTEQATDLDAWLRQRGIRRVVLVGLAQDVCVRATALDARRLGFDTVVIEAATRPVDRDAGKRALDELRAAGIEVV